MRPTATIGSVSDPTTMIMYSESATARKRVYLIPYRALNKTDIPVLVSDHFGILHGGKKRSNSAMCDGSVASLTSEQFKEYKRYGFED